MYGRKTRVSDSAKEAAAFNFGYRYRTIEEQLNNFAAEPGNPYSITDIALRISGLLRDKALRESLGHTESLQEVRSKARKERAAGPKKNVDVDARSHRTLSAAARKRIAAAKRAWWAAQREKQKPATRATYKRKPTAAALAVMQTNIRKAQAARWPKKKRILTRAQLAAMRANIALGRAARLAKKAA